MKSAKDHRWSSFCSFYSQGDEPPAVDHHWWWADDSGKLLKAMKDLGWQQLEWHWILSGGALRFAPFLTAGY
ncbi:MAG: hypothetical protein ACREBG_17215 [Pyrinomonadaceae bacterium]